MNNNVVNLNMAIAGEEEADKGEAVVKIEVLSSKTGRVKDSFEITMSRELAQEFLDRVWADVIGMLPNVTVARLLDSRTGKMVTKIRPRDKQRPLLLPGPTMTLEGLFEPILAQPPEEP